MNAMKEQVPDGRSDESDEVAHSDHLSFEMRKRALLEAALADGQAALVVEPIESPLWYVHHQTSFVESPDDDKGRVKRLLRLADEVIKESEQRADRIAESAGSGAAPSEAAESDSS